VTGPPAIASSVLRARHGFFGRAGGVSRGLYESLNAGPGSRDDPGCVRENRARIADAFGVAPERLLSLHQTHSARVVAVDAPWSPARPEADAMATTTPGLALCILSADCAPVLFEDAQAHVIGAAHAGWKGALDGVLEATLAAMERLGARRSNIAAAIGPCIGPASYEVGPEFRDRFVAGDPASAVFFAPGPGDRLRFDLPAFCTARLAAAGVTRIDALAPDTCALETAYFSNRRAVKRSEDDYGRNASVIALAP
jgi:hypothetical protein